MYNYKLIIADSEVEQFHSKRLGDSKSSGATTFIHDQSREGEKLQDSYNAHDTHDNEPFISEVCVQRREYRVRRDSYDSNDSKLRVKHLHERRSSDHSPLIRSQIGEKHSPSDIKEDNSLDLIWELLKTGKIDLPDDHVALGNVKRNLEQMWNMVSSYANDEKMRRGSYVS